MTRLYIAGIRGLVGSNLKKAALDNGYEVFGKSSSDLDFLDRKATFQELDEVKPSVLVIAAAKVGGIGANYNYPVEFLTRNLQIQCNLIDGAFSAGIEKVVFLGSSCIYPKYASQPIKEESILTGQLEFTNQPYAISKISGVELINSYRREYGTNWFSVMPCNLYGPGDNFNPESSHVLAALMRKIHFAKIHEEDNVVIWGDGSPQREFLFVGDMADAILHLVKCNENPGLINLGTGKEISILDLAKLIAKVVDYKGDFSFDKSKPNGTPRKVLNVDKLQNTGWQYSTSLKTGIEVTYNWYKENIGSLVYE